MSNRLDGVLSLCAAGGGAFVGGVDATRSSLLLGVDDVRRSLCKAFGFGTGVAADFATGGDSFAFFA